MTNRRAAAGAVSLLATAALVAAAGLWGGPAPQAAVVPSRAAAAAYVDGAPPGFSGGFGEQSCHACHFHAEVNAGPGRLTIADLPDRFVPGERYPLTIALASPGMKAAGFQLTARFEEGGAQAGMLAPAAGDEGRVRVDVQNGVQYAGQRRAGATPDAADTAMWTLIWTAPATSASVVFHVAANVADADESVRGDTVYTTTAESAPVPPGSPPAGSHGE